MISVPKPVFWPVAWALLLGLRAGNRLQGILVDNKKAWHRVAGFSRRAGAALSFVRPGADRYELWAETALWPEAAWQAAVRRCASH